MLKTVFGALNCFDSAPNLSRFFGRFGVFFGFVVCCWCCVSILLVLLGFLVEMGWVGSWRFFYYFMV